MAYLDKSEIHDAYIAASDEAKVWREDYPEYERLMDNGLMANLDENMPEVNDGSLAASLFKLAKRTIRKKLGGRAVALDRDDAYITEFANIQWENKIFKNANSQASPRRKMKDAARKAAGYGGQPIISLFVNRGDYEGADFIVPYCQDVKLEAGKVSDADSDIIFWDIYYTKLQVKNMLEEAEAEMKEEAEQKKAYEARKAEHEALAQDYQMRLASGMVIEGEEPPVFDEEEPSGYNKWDLECLRNIAKSGQETDRPGNEEHNEKQDKGVKKSGIHFYIAFQRGVNAPFYMCYESTGSDKKSSSKVVREWSNPDPTGDVPVHYLYCYQDFINPYGVGIVKLAGGTQNVLDYMRQADILATQLGLRPPKIIRNPDDVDEESLVYAEDANWYVTGNGAVERQELSTQVYEQLPQRQEMYLNSLYKVIPMGDTSVSAGAGDPMQSKTPAGVKLAAANLSIDDDDFSENVDECIAQVFKSMINIHFANMQGEDLIKLNDQERELLAKAGTKFPVGVDGRPTNELEFTWDEVRATFDFEIDPEADKATDEQQQMEGLKLVADLISNPNTQSLIQMAQMGQPLILGSHKVDLGELVGEIVNLSTDNDKIVTEITPEEMEEMQAQPAVDPATGQPIPPEMAQNGEPIEGEVVDPNQPPEMAEEEENARAIMEQYNVPINVALAMREAELVGQPEEAIMELKDMLMNDMQPQPEVANV